MRLVITRPEPDASRTAQALARLGHEPILSPMLDVVLDPAVALPEGPFQAVLATSSNAIRALAMHADRARFAKFFHGMMQEGVYLAPSQFEAGFISTAHGPIEIEKTLTAARKVLATL